MYVTLPIFTLVSPLHPENAYPLMKVMLSGMVTLVSPLQFANARSLMIVTLSGMVTLTSPLHPKNAYSPMIVTGKPLYMDGMTTFAL